MIAHVPKYHTSFSLSPKNAFLCYNSDNQPRDKKMIIDEIQSELWRLQDAQYRDFQC